MKEYKNEICSVSLKGKVLDFESNDVGSIPAQSKGILALLV